MRCSLSSRTPPAKSCNVPTLNQYRLCINKPWKYSYRTKLWPYTFIKGLLLLYKPVYMEPLELAISVKLFIGSFETFSRCLLLSMCGKLGFVSCCGGSSNEEREEEKVPSRTRRRQRSGSGGNNENCNEERPASGTEQTVDPSTINVNMVAPHTIKLLTDIREIKGYKQTAVDDDEIQKALEIHGDILARLENPTKFT